VECGGSLLREHAADPLDFQKATWRLCCLHLLGTCNSMARSMDDRTPSANFGPAKPPTALSLFCNISSLQHNPAAITRLCSKGCRPANRQHKAMSQDIHFSSSRQRLLHQRLAGFPMNNLGSDHGHGHNIAAVFQHDGQIPVVCLQHPLQHTIRISWHSKLAL